MFACNCVDSIACGVGLPASNSHIDIVRIQLDPIADSTGTFGNHECGATSKNSIQCNFVARLTNQYRIGDHHSQFSHRVSFE